MSLASLRLVSTPSGDQPASAGPTELDINELFRKHAPEVQALGVAMLGKADEADDLVQEVFLRAVKGIGSVRDPSKIRSWLITIAVREGRTRLRRRKVSRLFLAREEMDFEQLAAAGSTAEDKMQIARLFRVLDGLGVDLRIAWVLRYLQRETTQSVAEQCGWSLSTTKRRIQSAHKKVLQEIGL